jgi:transposase
MQPPEIKSYIGIDVSKMHLDICILPQGERFQIENSPQGKFKDLCRRLKKFSVELIVMESTGGYEAAVFKSLHKAGFKVARENGRNIYHHRQSRGKRAKTDGIDAETLAHYAQCYCKEIRTPGPLEERQENLKQLMEWRQDLVVKGIAAKNRLQGPVLNPAVQESCKRLLKVIQAEIEQVESLINNAIEQHEDWRQRRDILKSATGIGEITANLLLGHLPELGHIPNKQVASLVGVAPFHRESGQYKGKRCIQGGRFSVRSMLYMATLTAIRWCEKLKVFYQHLRNKGKAAKVALIACMRKLLVILNAMLRDNKPFNPAYHLAN